MKKILLLISIFVTIICQESIAQQNHPKLMMNNELQYLVAGELNSSFNFLIGGRPTLFLKSKGNFSPYVTSGIAFDIANPDSRFFSVDLQGGTYWRIENKLSFFASIGAQYINESHSFLLSDSEGSFDNEIWGVTANAGVNLKIYKSFGLVVFFKQTNLEYSSVGVGLRKFF